MDSSSGMLSSPSAEMFPSGTFSITNNFLNKHYTSNYGGFGWDYHTFAYGFAITFLSRVEIGYVCTIFNGDWNPRAETERQKEVKNQDRHFFAKALVLQENEFDSDWVPGIAIGISDPVTGSTSGEYIDSDVSSSGNGFFNRMYVAATKHFNTSFGEISGTLGYQYNLRKDPHYNAPCVAITWRPIWLENRWFNPRFILEYDSRSPNIGFISEIWDNRFEAMLELQNFQWISFGVRYRLRLKGAE